MRLLVARKRVHKLKSRDTLDRPWEIPFGFYLVYYPTFLCFILVCVIVTLAPSTVSFNTFFLGERHFGISEDFLFKMNLLAN